MHSLGVYSESDLEREFVLVSSQLTDTSTV